MLRKVLIIAAAVVIVLTGFLITRMMGTGKEESQTEKNFDAARYVFTDTVKYSTYPAIVNAYGTVKAKNKIAVFSEVQGIMLETNKEFETGNYFSKGEVLIKIDDREIDLQILSAKSDLITAITNLLPDLKTDYEESYQNWKNYLDNFELNEKIRPIPDFASNKEKYFLSNRGILKLYYNIQNLELRKEKHTIYAPFSGTVIESNVNYGSLINMGQRLGTFAQTNNYEAELTVIQDDIPFISIGNNVKLYSKTGDAEWEGRIIRIGDYIDPSTQSVKVFASVSGSKLKDGLYMNAEIRGADIPGAFRLPRKALYNNDFIYIIRDSVLDKTNVNVLKLSDEYVYINGIDSNQTVVKQALVSPEIGMKVKPISNEIN